METLQISGWGFFVLGACSGLAFGIFCMLLSGYMDRDWLAIAAEKRTPVNLYGRPHYVIPWHETTPQMRGEKPAFWHPDFREYPPKDTSHHDYDVRGNPLKPGS